MSRPHTLLLKVTALAVAAIIAPNSLKAQDWPQWRGPQRDGISAETGLLKEWPEEGPAVAWQVDSVGVGYSSLAIADGRIYTQGDLEGVEHVIALDAADGRRLWAVQPAPVAEALAEEVATHFTRADKNSDGKISEVEALQQFGTDFFKYDQEEQGDHESIARQRASALLQELDGNQDQRLSYSEAGQLLREYFERIDQADADADGDALAARRTAALIKMLDTDGDGKISKEESRNSPLDRPFGRADRRDPATNEADEQLTVEEIEAYLAKNETGKDGLLTADELQKFYANQQAGRDGVLNREELRGFYGGYRNGQGDGPRGTPTVDGQRIYTEGGQGDVTCFDIEGNTLWHVNLVKDLGGSRPGWGYSESPLIEGDLVIVTPGGKQGTLAALNKTTGEVVWRSEEVTEGAHYSSPVVATIAGVRQIVQFARNSVFGVDAANGKFLWKYEGAANGTANCFTPIVDDNLVFVSSAYGTGSGLAKISGTSGEQQAEEVYFLKKLASHHGGAVKIGDYLYSNGGGTIICIDFRTGDIQWQSRGVGKGSLIAADGMLYLVGERHEVELVEATPEEYRSHGTFKIENLGRPSWAHPVVQGGKLYVRNQQSLTAYEIQAK